MNSYEAKQEARRQRYLDRAEQARQEFEDTHERAHKMAEAIPFGQPLLVGHHSEKRDRNYRGRIHDTFGRAFAALEKAEHYEGKAASVGHGGISSDDPDALQKLRAKLAEMESSQALMKAANQAIRRHKTDEARIAALVPLGFTEAQAQDLVKPDYIGRVGYAPFTLSNHNANMRRVKERIAELEHAATRQYKEEQAEGYTYREDPEENRVMFIFDGKPAENVRQLLKSHGFKWSPTRGAWVRQITGNALFAARCVRQGLAELSA